MAKFVSEKIRMKSAARLAAVQATYMAEFGQLPVDEVIKDFVNGDVGRYVIDDKSDEYTEDEEFVRIGDMDTAYFAELTRGVHKNKEQLEKSLAQHLHEGWSFEHFDGTLRALLLCAAYELAYTSGLDAPVLVKEYVDLAYAFFAKNEPKMVNALLDQIAKKIRPA